MMKGMDVLQVGRDLLGGITMMSLGMGCVFSIVIVDGMISLVVLRRGMQTTVGGRIPQSMVRKGSKLGMSCVCVLSACLGCT